STTSWFSSWTTLTVMQGNSGVLYTSDNPSFGNVLTITTPVVCMGMPTTLSNTRIPIPEGQSQLTGYAPLLATVALANGSGTVKCIVGFARISISAPVLTLNTGGGSTYSYTFSRTLGSSSVASQNASATFVTTDSNTRSLLQTSLQSLNMTSLMEQNAN